MLSVEGSSETRPFRHLCNDVFRSPYLQKYSSYEGKTFYEKCSKFQIDFENGKKNQKIFSVFVIIAFELVALNCLYSAGNACHRQSMR